MNSESNIEVNILAFEITEKNFQRFDASLKSALYESVKKSIEYNHNKKHFPILHSKLLKNLDRKKSV